LRVYYKVSVSPDSPRTETMAVSAMVSDDIGYNICLLFGQSIKPDNPTRAAAIPPVNNQTDLSVGAPVKKRDTSELNDSKVLTPQMINTIPTTNRATEISLFIFNYLFYSAQSQLRPGVAKSDQHRFNRISKPVPILYGFLGNRS